MNGKFQTNQNQNNAQHARSVDTRDAARMRVQVCNCENDCNDEIVSKETAILSRIMKSEKEERKSQVRLSKRHKTKFRKNRLWDKKQRNGNVICIAPENYQNLG
jgi:hypothetical protein